MKSISASIIVFAGVALILGGAQIEHDDTKTFVQAAGCVVGAVGFWGWLVTIKQK